MLKNVIIAILFVFLFSGCEANKQNESSSDTLSPLVTELSTSTLPSPSVKISDPAQIDVMNVDISNWQHPLKELFSSWQYKKNKLVSIQLLKNKTYPVFTFSSFEPASNSYESSMDALNEFALYDLFNTVGEKNGWWDFELRTEMHDWKVNLNKEKKFALKVFDSVSNRSINFNDTPCDSSKFPTMNEDIVVFVKTKLASIDRNLTFNLDMQQPKFQCQKLRDLKIELVDTGIFNFMKYDSDAGSITNDENKANELQIVDSNGEDLLLKPALRNEYEKVYAALLSALALKHVPNEISYFFCAKSDCEPPNDRSALYSLYISKNVETSLFHINLRRQSDTINTYFYASLTKDGVVNIMDDSKSPVKQN